MHHINKGAGQGNLIAYFSIMVMHVDAFIVFSFM